VTKSIALPLLAAFIVTATGLTGCATRDATPVAASTRPFQPPTAVAREARVRSLADDGASIRYRVYGKGEPAIVFVHGWSCDSSYWDRQVDHFAKRHTVVTVDLAGHGDSPAATRNDWTIANFGADIAAAVKAAGVQRAVLVGSSMGGPVALEAARRLPGQVIGIVGVDTFRDIAQPYPKEMVEGLLAQMRQDFPGATAAFVGGSFFTEQSDPALKQWIVTDMSSAQAAVAIPAIIGLTQMDYTAALDAIDVPVIALNSTHPPTDEATIRRKEPRFRVQTMDGVGHFPMLEKPVEFNGLLERILAEWK
jgi:pimeloyl-ACP methyl ester carboxylesterase